MVLENANDLVEHNQSYEESDYGLRVSIPGAYMQPSECL
jgi:hypothetical protein